MPADKAVAPKRGEMEAIPGETVDLVEVTYLEETEAPMGAAFLEAEAEVPAHLRPVAEEVEDKTAGEVPVVMAVLLVVPTAAVDLPILIHLVVAARPINPPAVVLAPAGTADHTAIMEAEAAEAAGTAEVLEAETGLQAEAEGLPILEPSATLLPKRA